MSKTMNIIEMKDGTILLMRCEINEEMTAALIYDEDLGSYSKSDAAQSIKSV